MPRKKPLGVFVELSKDLMTNIERIASDARLETGTYIAGLVMQVVMGGRLRGGAKPDLEPKPLGRPPRPAPPLLPPDVERSDSVTGFVGVYKNGRYFKAVWDKGDPLGVFETAELAAFARYYFVKGRASTAATPEIRELVGGYPQTAIPYPRLEPGQEVEYDPPVGPPRKTVINGVVDYDDGTFTYVLRDVVGPAQPYQVTPL